MKSSHLVSLVSILATGLVFGATRDDRPLPGEWDMSQRTDFTDYGPPIRIASSVLAFQPSVETSRPPKSEKILSNAEFAADGDDRDGRIPNGAGSGYLRFVGVVGTGHIYVPDDSADRAVTDGLLRISRP